MPNRQRLALALQADEDWQAIASGPDTALIDVREPAELERASAAWLHSMASRGLHTCLPRLPACQPACDPTRTSLLH